MSSIANVFDNDEFLSSDLFLELEAVSPLSQESGDMTPTSTFEFDQLATAYATPSTFPQAKQDMRYNLPSSIPMLIPHSPEATRPSSPTSSVSSNLAPYTSRYPASLANSKLSEEEKEKIRREKKREADRKCRKRKKERINDMENKMRRLEDERHHLISKLDMLERTRALSPSSAVSDPNAAHIAQSAVHLFNGDLPYIANFVKNQYSETCENITQAKVTTSKNAVVKDLLAMKTKFPGSNLKVTSVKDETAGKYHFSWTITGALSNGKPLTLDGHSFITVAGGLVVKTVNMWDDMSVMAQMLGITQDELVKKSESASHFEDFVL